MSTAAVSLEEIAKRVSELEVYWAERGLPAWRDGGAGQSGPLVRQCTLL